MGEARGSVEGAALPGNEGEIVQWQGAAPRHAVKSLALRAWEVYSQSGGMPERASSDPHGFFFFAGMIVASLVG